MANQQKVHVIGRHAEMLAKVTAMLRASGYYAIGAQGNDDAITIFSADQFDAVVVGDGVDGASGLYFHTVFPQINPQVKIIDGHPGTVLNELRIALK
jgi:DNA-binding response OmpR family regulator